MTTRPSRLIALSSIVCTAALTLAGCGGGSGSGTSLAKFCKDGNSFNNRLQSVQDGSGYTSDGQAQLHQLAGDAKNLVGEAPAPIRNDMDALAKYLAIAATRPTTSAEDDAVSAAGDRIDSYVGTKCDAATGSKDAVTPKTTTSEPPTVDTTFDTTPSVDTTVEPSIAMPDLRNATVSDAEAQLASAGVTSDPTIVEQKDATVAPGLVVDQDPTAGSEVTSDETVTLTVSAVPDQAYLSDFQASAGQFRSGVASMKGVAYTHGVLQSQGANYTPQKTTFTLSSHYARLKGVVGLDDSFTGGASVQVEIFDQDNASLFKKTVKVGQPVTIDIPVSGVIQLTLEATDLLSNVANSGTVVWGDLQVISGS
jgi:hypothetical protein